MKKILMMAALLALAVCLFAACDAVTTTPVGTTAVTPNGYIPALPVSIEQALAMGEAITENNAKTYATFTLSATVTALGENSVTLTEDGHSIVCLADGEALDTLYVGATVTLTGRVQKRDGSIVFVDVTVDQATAATYIVSTLLSDHGEITVSKMKDIAFGESVTVTATAKSGYVVSCIKVNGEIVSTSSSVTLTVTENLSVEAVFLLANAS